MLGLGLRAGLRRGALRVLDVVEELLSDAPVVPATPEPHDSRPPPDESRPPPQATAPEATPEPEPEPVVEAEPEPDPEPEPVVETDRQPELVAESASEAPFTADQLELVLDEMVRPALHMDGGDMTLIKIDGQDIIVRLIGACSTCPSSTITMKQGIQRLLEEEFPTWTGELIQVDTPF